MAKHEDLERRLKRFEELINQSEEALQDRPDNQALRLNLGTVLRLRERLQEQLEVHNEARLTKSGVTPYHAQYFALELLKRCATDATDRFASALLDAKVDLNPHQVDAALFAFQSPLSKGALLADEVGLGKTIEAGLVLAQFWAERKRNLLIIVPASLRMQWHQELQEKFYLPALILETKSFNAQVKAGIDNPFERPATDRKIVICSYNFARNKSRELAAVPWDLVVIDEAHRLRNVYKTSNKIARDLKACLQNRRKILLTATPLQNSLLELYGLVSFIDDYVFGDQRSFQAQFGNLGSNGDFSALKERLESVCKRTLRKQVLEYIKYTERVPLTIEFHPTDEEHELYEMVSDYLRRPSLAALPASQRSLMTLVLRKLLASSTFAIAGALGTLARKLRERLRENAAAAKKAAELHEELAQDFEEMEEIEEEWDEEESEPELLTAEDVANIENEITELEEFRDRATSIVDNEKGRKLLTALELGFAEANRLGAAQKAVVFTESRRTQDYLLRILSETPLGKGIVLFNGSNNDPRSQEIYRAWKEIHKNSDRVTGSPSADIRAALVDYFRDRGQIMIATEAAAEGINLQFCSLVVNYDLPWNPQRIEQRIGRCHRYGQRHDVVVVNFLNKRNAADQRVFQLLSEKFQLFDGVFGASDEVLGAIESGVDFEKRIAAIYQNCRSSDDIQLQFDFLQREMDETIRSAMADTRRRLLENVDEIVLERLRNFDDKGRSTVNRYERWLWNVTQHGLRDRAQLLPDRYAFILHNTPLPEEAPNGYYALSRHARAGHSYRLGHPLAQQLLDEVRTQKLPAARIVFDCTRSGVRVTPLKALVGKEGTLLVSQFSLNYQSGEGEDHVLLTAITDDGSVLDDELACDLFRLPGTVESLNDHEPDPASSHSNRDECARKIMASAELRNAGYFDEETSKLDAWAEDMKQSLERELKQLDADIREAKKERKAAADLSSKLEWERKLRSFESRRAERRRALYEEQDKIEERRDSLITEVERKLRQTSGIEDIFMIRWRIV